MSGVDGSRFSLFSLSLVAGGQRDSRTDLVETVVGSSVSSKAHRHDDEMHAMAVTRTRTEWEMEGCGRVPYDYSKDLRNTEPLAARLRTEIKAH